MGKLVPANDNRADTRQEHHSKNLTTPKLKNEGGKLVVPKSKEEAVKQAYEKALETERKYHG
jgi:hypothetical protein